MPSCRAGRRPPRCVSGARPHARQHVQVTLQGTSLWHVAEEPRKSPTSTGVGTQRGSATRDTCDVLCFRRALVRAARGVADEGAVRGFWAAVEIKLTVRYGLCAVRRCRAQGKVWVGLRSAGAGARGGPSRRFSGTAKPRGTSIAAHHGRQCKRQLALLDPAPPPFGAPRHATQHRERTRWPWCPIAGRTTHVPGSGGRRAHRCPRP